MRNKQEWFKDKVSAVPEKVMTEVQLSADIIARIDAILKEKNMTQMRRDWEKKFNAANATDYMTKNNALVVSPSVSVSLPSDSADISVIRNSVNQAVCDASWRMIFAKNDAEFDKMWDDMVKELKGFGFDELYKFDVEKHTIEVNAKLAAMK